MGAQQARAETVDGRDPCAVELAREIRPAALAESGADPRPQLTGGLAGVRDDEDRLDVDAALTDCPDVALDEDGRLARPCARGDEDRPVRVDGSYLLLVEPCL